MRFSKTAYAVLGAVIAGTPVCVSAEEQTQKEAEQLDFAGALLSRGMYDMAQAEYQKFLTLFPQSVRREEAVFASAETSFLAQDFPKSLEAFNNFKKDFPNAAQIPTASLRLGQIYISQNKYDEALKELGAVDADKDLKGEMAQAFHFYSAQAYKGKGDPANAVAYFQKAAAVADASTYTASAFQAVGELQAQNAKYPEAAEAYSKALGLVQEENLKGYLIYRLGETQFLAKNYPEAIVHFQQVLDQYSSLSTTKDALTNLLLARYNSGQYDYMLAVYKNSAALIKDEPSYFDVHFAVARAYLQMKDYDQAMQLLDKILAWPELSEEAKQKATVVKAEILVKQSKYQEGIDLIKNVPANAAANPDERVFVQAQSYYGLGDFQKAGEAFGDIVNNHPNSNFAKAALLGLAHCRQETGNHAEAASLFLKYYAAAPDDQNVKSEALYSAALMESKANINDHAIALAEKYLQEFPKGAYFEPAVLLLANLYAATRQSEKAVALLQDYLAHPEGIQDQGAVYFLLGYNQQLLGQNEPALATYAKVALGHDPKFYASSLKNSATVYLSQKNDEQAAAFFDRLITELDKNFLELQTYLWLCNQYLKEKKFKGVLRIASKAEAYFPGKNQQELLYFKAEALRNLQDYEQARKGYDEVLALPGKNSFSGAAHIGKGLSFMAVGKFEEAQPELQKAVEENADDQTITMRARYELGNTMMGLKKPDEALRFYLLVATIYQDNRYCPESLFKAAGILEGLNRKPDARKLYQEIADKYKESPQVAAAKERISALSDSKN